MTTEIERKFLVKEKLDHIPIFGSELIIQGYLSADPGRTVRVRLQGSKGFMTVKGNSNESGTTRTEIEFEIEVEKAKELLLLCLPGNIVKTRHYCKVGVHVWEIDEFHNANTGLVLAEIELLHENEVFEIPNWVNQEVTGNVNYYNSVLREKEITNEEKYV